MRSGCGHACQVPPPDRGARRGSPTSAADAVLCILRLATELGEVAPRCRPPRAPTSKCKQRHRHWLRQLDRRPLPRPRRSTRPGRSRPERNGSLQGSSALVGRPNSGVIETDRASVMSNDGTTGVVNLKGACLCRIALGPFDPVFLGVRTQPDAARLSVKHTLRRVYEFYVDTVLAGAAPCRQIHRLRAAGHGQTRCRGQNEPNGRRPRPSPDARLHRSVEKRHPDVGHRTRA